MPTTMRVRLWLCLMLKLMPFCFWDPEMFRWPNLEIPTRHQLHSAVPAVPATRNEKKAEKKREAKSQFLKISMFCRSRSGAITLSLHYSVTAACSSSAWPGVWQPFRCNSIHLQWATIEWPRKFRRSTTSKSCECSESLFGMARVRKQNDSTCYRHRPTTTTRTKNPPVHLPDKPTTN